jgi:carboxyl-terminal processing protease
MTESVPTPPEAAPDPLREHPTARRISPLAWVLSIALAAVLGALLFGGGYLAAGGASAGGGSCSAPTAAFTAFCEAYGRLKQQYVDKLNDQALAEGAIRGMFQFGVKDPYSAYMPPADYQRALGDLSGKFSGIGAEMAVKNLADPGNLEACTEFSDNCVFVVVAPIAGTPAEKAGLKAGDLVLAVDGKSVKGSTIEEEIAKVRGEAGTKVTLTIKRGDKQLDLAITRSEITIQEVETRMLSDRIAYIKLNGFSDSAAAQFRTALKGLLDKGAQQIVFDLRNNPGGYIESARQIASQFIDSGVIFTQESSGEQTKTWEATGDGVATSKAIQVAVLVNSGSASASEIVAAALKEHGRATIIGEHTFGKNTVQVWSKLGNNGGVRITISRWFTPKHNSVAPNGVQPDIPVAIPPETPPEQDLVLEKAISFLQSRAVGEGAPSPSPSGSPSAFLGGGALAWEPAAGRAV